MKIHMNHASLENPDRWIAERRGFTNHIEIFDMVCFTNVSVKYIDAKLNNLIGIQQKLTNTTHWAARNSAELLLFKELQKISRSRAVGLTKKIEERLAMARGQFRKKSFRVSFSPRRAVV